MFYCLFVFSLHFSTLMCTLYILSLIEEEKNLYISSAAKKIRVYLAIMYFLTDESV